MNILVTNDDGIDSNGIFALVHALRKLGNVFVVAPDSQQSAVGHALTMNSPLRATKFHRDGEMFGFAVNGTPADCVKLGITSLLSVKPDLVVSGVNHGSNTSVNILYSGTVSAATEGMLMGIPSIAVSLATFDNDADCAPAAEIATFLATRLDELNLPKDTLLNVNVPVLALEQIKGIKITRQGLSSWNDSYEKRQDPMGHDYYWIKGEYVFPEIVQPDADDIVVQQGFVSVTPIRFELTNLEVMKRLEFLEKAWDTPKNL